MYAIAIADSTHAKWITTCRSTCFSLAWSALMSVPSRWIDEPAAGEDDRGQRP
jgi:hypothetical protein